ncbi:MAG: site-specific integrase [Gemmatimonadota bacterium]
MYDPFYLLYSYFWDITLVGDRVEQLVAQRRNRAILGVARDAPLARFVQEHLIAKAKANRITVVELGKIELRLQRAVEFFGSEREVGSIGVADVERWVDHLSKLPGRRGRGLTASSLRQHLSALSNLYRRAQAEGVVPPGFNPPTAMMDKPRPVREEARWLEVHDCALVLEAARVHRTERDDEIRDLDPLVATFLLTGRKSEILGLEVEDVSFDRRTVTFRPNEWRRLKTATSHRSVPLWPQLHEILKAYLSGGASSNGKAPVAKVRRTSGLLFPSVRTGKMIHDMRKALNGVAERAGWEAGQLTTKMFRHSYCAARLQSLDQGAPVSPFTVARELGHGGMAMVNRVYGHLGQVRHRAEVVEFRADQHKKCLGKRLTAVRAWKPAQCQATTPGGERCRVRGKLSEHGLCLWHDPARREAARRARPNARG